MPVPVLARDRLKTELLAFLEALELPLGVRLWDGTRTGPPDAKAGVWIREPAALARLFQGPLDLALGEAFVAGEIEIEGSIEDLLAELERAAGRLSPRALLARMARARGLRREIRRLDLSARLRGRRHSPARDRAAIRHHYDVGNAFFRLWLDRRMIYSCAYFPEGDEDLDTAQAKKLEHTLKKLLLHPGDHLLDIGSGWGGLALFAAEHFGARVTGVTVSEAQVAYARAWAEAEGLSHQVSFLPFDYHEVRGTFDKIVSVGMAEHVGAENLPLYFRRAWENLKPGGLFLHYVITRGPVPPAFGRELASGEFLRRYVFPDGEILPLWQHLQAAEQAGFEVRDVEDLREHYAKTLRHWVRRLEERWQEAVGLVGEARARVWWLYMGVSAYQFAAGHLAIHQVLLAKPGGGGRVYLPPSRAHLYAG